MNIVRRLRPFLLIVAVIFSFTSCIGLSIDIQLNRDGSGRITMEYRISRTLENLGALDGNVSMPAIPVSRADWEKTIERISGAKLVSFSSVQRGQDTVITAALDFSSMETLLMILDPEGSKTNIGLNQFSLILNGNAEAGSSQYFDTSEYDENLINLARLLFSDYDFSISFSASGNSTLTITDGTGKEINPPSAAQVLPRGRRVSMSIGIIDLIEIKEGLGVVFRW